MQRLMGMVAAFFLLIAFVGLSPAVSEITPGGKPDNKVKQITGEVMEIDLKAQTVTIRGKNGTVAIGLSERTKVMKDREPRNISDVQVGDRVTIKYRNADGKQTAKSLHIKSASKKTKPPA